MARETMVKGPPAVLSASQKFLLEFLPLSGLEGGAASTVPKSV